MDTLIDIDAVAARLGITPRGVRSLTHRRQLTFVKVSGRLRFRHQDVDDFIETRLVEAERLPPLPSPRRRRRPAERQAS